MGRKPIDREQMKQRVLDAAEKSVATQGLVRSSMSDLVRASGVSRRTFYKVFRSKDDVIKGLVDRKIEGTFEKAFGIEFETYFARELEVLGELEADGLVTIAGGNHVQLTFPLGRVLMRNVAAVFDAYLEPDAYRVGESSYFSANA